MQTTIAVENGKTQEALRGFLKSLLERGVVDALLVPMPAPNGAVGYALIEDPAEVQHAVPLAPVVSHNGGSLLGRLTDGAAGRRVGAVLRNCELRAAVELSKVRQVDLDKVLLIGVDCLGSYELSDYLKLVTADADPLPALLSAAREGRVAPAGDVPFRVACQMCEYPLPGENGAFRPAISISLLGLPNDQQVWITVTDDDVAAKLELQAADAPPAGREAAVKSLIAARTAERDRRIAAVRQRLHGPTGLMNELAACIGCHNCMGACPICYCKQCVFLGPVFDYPSRHYFSAADRAGATFMPGDTMLFHITRMNHMAHACVGCGMCTSACPNDIPVGELFRSAGQAVQAIFDYLPGRDPAEDMPVATFREDELHDLGDKG